MVKGFGGSAVAAGFHQMSQKDYAGGRGELLIRPSTLLDFSGSGRSHVRHRMVAVRLPSGGAARIIFRPHRGQFECAVANECPSADALPPARPPRPGRGELGGPAGTRPCFAGVSRQAVVAIASKREPAAGAIGPTCSNRSVQLADRKCDCVRLPLLETIAETDCLSGVPGMWKRSCPQSASRLSPIGAFARVLRCRLHCAVKLAQPLHD